MKIKRTYHFEKKVLILVMVLLLVVGSLSFQLFASEENCDHSVTDIKREDEIAPGCTEPGGYTEIVYCVNCNAELSRQSVSIPAEHTPGAPVWENEVPATCTTPGSHDQTVYCMICGTELSRESVEIPATEHVPGDMVHENEIPATDTAPGSYDQVIYCQTCGTELNRETVEVPATEHVPGEIVHENEIPATDTAPGSHDEVVYCQTCGMELSRNTVEDPALMPYPENKEETKEVKPDVPDVHSGSCGLYGEELKWELDPEDKLTIHPDIDGMNGAMEDYQDETNKTAPWYGYRHNIKTIEIEEGVIHIGSNAFRGCDKLETIKIASSVTSIGEYAFYDCVFLNKVEFAGTNVQWSEIEIKDNNPTLNMAELQYALVVEEEPAEETTAEPAEESEIQTEADTAQTQIECIVSFDLNGHAFSIDPQIITEGKKAVLPTNPGEEGYGFGGWFREAECINEWDFDTDTVTEDMTLYAKWLKAPVLAKELIFNDEEQSLITSADERTWIRIEDEEEKESNTRWIPIENTAERMPGLHRMDAGTYSVYWYYGNEAPAEEETGVLVGQVVIAKADAIILEVPKVNLEDEAE